MFTHHSGLLSIVTAIALLTTAGCNKKSASKSESEKSKSGHAAHDKPLTAAEKKQFAAETDTFAKAVAKIKELRDKIKQECTQGEPEHAHRSLDLLDIVLKKLTTLAKDGIDKKHWQTIGESAGHLRDAFNAVHKDIDDAKKPDYDAVAKKIDDAITKLEAIK